MHTSIDFEQGDIVYFIGKSTDSLSYGQKGFVAGPSDDQSQLEIKFPHDYNSIPLTLKELSRTNPLAAAEVEQQIGGKRNYTKKRHTKRRPTKRKHTKRRR